MTTDTTESVQGLATVLRNGDLVTLRFQRQLPTGLEDAWAALTDAGRLRQWFMPTTIEPRFGGTVHVDGGSDGGSHGTVTAWEPPRLLAYTWQWVGDEGTERQTEVRWELTEAATGSLLVFTHAGLEPGWTASYGAGWHGFLDALADAGVNAAQAESAVRPAYDAAFGSLLS